MKTRDYGDLNELVALAEEYDVSVRIDYSPSLNEMSVEIYSADFTENFFMKRITHIPGFIERYKDSVRTQKADRDRSKIDGKD